MPNSRTTGLPPGVFVGATGPRLLAALVEVGPVWLLCGLALLFGLVLDGSVIVVVLCLVVALVWAALVWAQRANRAAGPGMRLDSLQLVGLSDGRPLGWGRVLLRWLVFAGLTITVVGLVAMLIVMARHPRRQGWHDLAANAVVIKERPLAPPRPKSAVARTAPAGTTGARPTPAAGTSTGRGPASTGDPVTASSGTATAGGPGEVEETVVVAESEGATEADQAEGDLSDDTSRTDRKRTGTAGPRRRDRRSRPAETRQTTATSPRKESTGPQPSRRSRPSGCSGSTTDATSPSSGWSCSAATPSPGWARRTPP